MEIPISIDSDLMSLAQAKQAIQTCLDASEECSINLEMRPAENKIRIVESVVLVAIVGAAGTALGALITGLLRFVQQSSAQTITIHSAGGHELVFPANLKKEHLDELIKMAKDLDGPRIVIR